MTAHAHDPSARRVSRPVPATAGARTTSTLPRWLLPALAVGIVAAGLVVAGVVSLSAVLYAGLFAGMILMHAGGHGGHGVHGGHSDHGAAASRDENLSQRSLGSQAGRSRSASGLDDRASDDPHGSETHGDDQRNAHACH